MTIILLSAIACWNGLSTWWSHDSVRFVDNIAALVFIGVFVFIQLVFYIYITKQVTRLESYGPGAVLREAMGAAPCEKFAPAFGPNGPK